MKILVDENIAYGEEAFSQFGEVSLTSGRNFSAERVKEYDILIIRSISKMNSENLEGSRVKFIGTATIGQDHVDTDYLSRAGIKFASAAGCNSYAVTEYVFSAISYLAGKYNFNFKDKTLGIIGVGNIGSKIASMGEAAGFTILKNDPPIERKTGDRSFRPLTEVLEADFITLHVPLNFSGEDKTYHLIDVKELSGLKPGSVLINSSRGPVINNQALKEQLLGEKNIYSVLDVWENEPSLDLELLNLVDLATPHIAGYSFEGKVNGTIQIYQQLCTFLKQKPEWIPKLPEVLDNEILLNAGSETEIFYKIFEKVYPIKKDDYSMRKILELEECERDGYFDSLRKNYSLRRELCNFVIKFKNGSNYLKPLLEKFRLRFHN